MVQVIKDKVAFWPRPAWRNAETHFKRIINYIHFMGIYPGPTILNLVIHNRKSRHLNGRETKWRREEMQRLNIPLQRPNQKYMTMFNDYEATSNYE